MSPRTPVAFIVVAAGLHLAGVLLRLQMGASGDFALRPVHAHLNVVGWSSLALYGLAWATWPALGGRALRRTHLAVAASSGALLLAGLFLELSGGPAAPLIVGSLGWAVGAAMFLAMAVRLLLRRPDGGRNAAGPSRRTDSVPTGPPEPAVLAPAILRAELSDLGVREGDLLMVHASIRAIGPVAGGPCALGDVLADAVGQSGSLMGYAAWDRSPYEETLNGRSLDAAARDRWPAFDPGTAGVYPGFGFLNAVLRERPGSVRSAHPDASMVAVGPKAAWLVAPHRLGEAFGPGSPLERLVAARGRILLLGAGPDSVTVLHYAEAVADIPGKRRVSYEMPLRGPGGETVWTHAEDFDSNGILDCYAGPGPDAVERIAAAYMAEGRHQEGPFGRTRAFLFEAEDLVRFGVAWLEAHHGRTI